MTPPVTPPDTPNDAALNALEEVIAASPLRQLRGLSTLSPQLLGLLATTPALHNHPRLLALKLSADEHTWLDLYLCHVREISQIIPERPHNHDVHPATDAARFLMGEEPRLTAQSPLNHWAVIGAGLRLLPRLLDSPRPGTLHLPLQPKISFLTAMFTNPAASATPPVRWPLSTQPFMAMGAGALEARTLLALTDLRHAGEMLNCPPDNLREWRAQRTVRRALKPDNVSLPTLGLFVPWGLPGEAPPPPLEPSWASVVGRVRAPRPETRPSPRSWHEPRHLQLPALHPRDRSGSGLNLLGTLAVALSLPRQTARPLWANHPQTARDLTRLLRQLGPAPWPLRWRVRQLRRDLESHA